MIVEDKSSDISKILELYPGKVIRATSVVNFDPYYQPVVEYLLGDLIICDDAVLAKRITFESQFNVKCVTLDGVVYDSEGFITGGLLS